MKNTILKKLKSVGESLPTIPTGSKHIKIAITGLSRSGKTVFISSLIDQLLHQNRLLSLSVQKSAFKASIKAPLHNAQRFDYYSLIEVMKREHKWPRGTDSITHTVLEFESKSRFAFMNNKTFSIELIDYPGEWLLDLSLLELEYEQWSVQSLQWLMSLDDEEADTYLESVDSLDSRSKGMELELMLHTQYKNLLSNLKTRHYSRITPGRFIMPSDLANDPILHFAPIKKSDSALHEVYKMRYEAYVKEVVKDIHLEHFRGFERQVVLVDVIEALQSGYGCYSDMRAGLSDMLKLYNHKNKNFISQWLSPSIKNVLFVATKADQVSASQHANFSLLLEEMVGVLRHELDISHIKTDTQLVSALKSTVSIEKKHEGMKLSFVRGILSEDGKLHDLYPGEMPSHFPNKNSWDTEAYAYKGFLPPRREYSADEALEHINMDKVIEKLIGDLL